MATAEISSAKVEKGQYGDYLLLHIPSAKGAKDKKAYIDVNKWQGPGIYEIAYKKKPNPGKEGEFFYNISDIKKTDAKPVTQPNGNGAPAKSWIPDPARESSIEAQVALKEAVNLAGQLASAGKLDILTGGKSDADSLLASINITAKALHSTILSLRSGNGHKPLGV